MIVAVQRGDHHKRAFMIPAAAIRNFLHRIPSEIRQVGPNFCAVWTVFATCVLTLLVSHLLPDRWRSATATPR